MNRPQYNCQTEGRLANALAKASQMKHRAHWIGTSPNDGANVYQVWSNTHTDGITYFVRAYQTPHNGGYVYLRASNVPAHWLTCTCESWTTYQTPCCHAAKVALRLQREARHATPKMLETALVYK